MRGTFGFTEFRKTSNMHILKFSKQTVGAKVHGREGNSPDCMLRS